MNTTNDNSTDTIRTLDLTEHYIVIGGAAATPIEGGEAFWTKLFAGDSEVAHVHEGWLVSSFRFDAPWGTWERHPNGDEIVHVLSGACDFVFDLDGDHRVVPVAAGETVVVPQGVWHTATVHEPVVALHITFGSGTEHRPVE